MYTHHQWGDRGELGPTPPNAKIQGPQYATFRAEIPFVKAEFTHSENVADFTQWITVADQPMRSYKSYPRAADVLCAEM